MLDTDTCPHQNAVEIFGNTFDSTEPGSPVWSIFECPDCGLVWDEDHGEVPV